MYELGSDIGKYYSVNVPLREGIDDHCKLCQSVMFVEVFLTVSCLICMVAHSCDEYTASNRIKAKHTLRTLLLKLKSNE